jgi:2-polyprenyl-3-methyl-5-hydroxy-6-metoxy-1,4-benzoquinol methylase
MEGPAKDGVDDWDAHWDSFTTANKRNPAQEYRRRIVTQLLERRGAPVRLLDIGSGNGEFLRTAGQRWPGAELIGIEMSETGVAESRARVAGAEFRVCDLLTGPGDIRDDRGVATHAVCSEVLEHVDDPVTLLRNARAWLAPGCRLVVTVPGGPMSAFDRHIGHRRHFSPTTLRETLTEAGLEVALTAGSGFPVFNIYRTMVILAGERLVTAGDEAADRSVAGTLLHGAMLAFRPLFWLNLPRSRFGWQTVGVAYEPWA